MRLWTLQSKWAARNILRMKSYSAKWACVYEEWRPVMQWMAQEMERRGIPMRGKPPIWAWHSCGRLNAPPTLLTASLLLSDSELKRGIEVLELDVPTGQCLLSSYQRWNEFFDRFLDMGRLPGRSRYIDMFTVPPVQQGDDIQAALPRIERSWVRAHWSLRLKPGDYRYNPSQIA